MNFQNQLALIIAVACSLTTLTANLLAVDWELLPEQCHDVELSHSTDQPDSTIQIRTTGRDPFLVGRLAGPRQANSEVLAFEYLCPSGIKAPTAILGPPLVGKGQIKLPELGIAEGWHSYVADLSKLVSADVLSAAKLLRIDLGNHQDVRLQIRDVRLRPKTAPERKTDAERERIRQEKLIAAQKHRLYLQTDFPVAFESVSVTTDQIRIHGKLPPDLTTVRLYEYPPESALTDSGVVVDAKLEPESSVLKINLPRFNQGRDRLHSGWRIQNSTGAWVSPRSYATEIALQSDDVASNRPIPGNQKGLTSVGERGPMEELPELGISSMSFNLVLTRFLANGPGPNRVRIDTPGNPVYFDPAAFASYDRTIEFGRKHDIVVTAIVLIPSPRRGSRQVSPLVHLENDGGVYAMPDLTTARGTKIYAYVLDRIAERYRNHERSPGGITNWIAHNEVDFHTVWTNMGDQPRPIVTETYYRSMRMIQNAAKQQNPYARVFVSLTHHWVVDDDGSVQHSWRQLAPREMLQDLQRYSKLEGDFQWGVAYHPYPQSLFAKVAWNDKKVTDDFDTPLITIQNLEVLGRFLSEPGMRTSTGQVRPVLLSEQGFHTDSYDADAQDRQAASLWYAMQKVKRMPMVESFQYHRWIDHPSEGGLMLGLRTLPTPDQKYGTKKKAWYVYQAIGTDQEETVTKDLPRP